MSRRVVEVTTGTRLHFGLLAFGQPQGRQFGGAGAMIDGPGYRLRISAGEELVTAGPAAALARQHAVAVGRADWFQTAPRCRIEILQAPPPHVGLGSGTQLALAVAAGLGAYFGRQAPAPAELARTVGRGARSAIGLHGFLHGGLLAEAGKLADEEISPLVSRVDMPDAWRFLLVRPAEGEGYSGDAERQAFARVPPVPLEVTARMCRETLLGILPAAAQGNYAAFCESLFRYGEDAGRCFSTLQGGIYASPRTAAVVELLRELGLAGVAQSSWGPTVFAVLPNQEAALSAEANLRQRSADLLVGIAAPRNVPASIVVAD